MTEKEKLLLALEQIEDMYDLIRGNQSELFFASHLLNIKYELKRQVSILTREEKSSRLKK